MSILISAFTPSLIDLDPSVRRHLLLPDRIYGTLKHRILTCVMAPGQRIVEKDLCSELDVSRTPLREALNRLSLEGLVVWKSYRGYAAAPLTVDDFRQLCEVRRIMESGAAGLSAERATKQDIERLRSTAELKYVPGNRKTYADYLRANSVFHLALARSTHNDLLETMTMSVLDRHQRPLYLGLDVGIDAEAGTREHLGIVDSIAAKDIDRARRMMTEHISGGEARITAALRAAGL